MIEGSAPYGLNIISGKDEIKIEPEGTFESHLTN